MKLDLANNDDLVAVRLGVKQPNEVRRFECSGMVDSGAAHLVLPQEAMDALGLPETRKARTRYADGRVEPRSVIKNVSLTLCNRESVFSAVIEPGRSDALIGAIVMEELDLIIDCTSGQLIPRDPEMMTSAMEGIDDITFIDP